MVFSLHDCFVSMCFVGQAIARSKEVAPTVSGSTAVGKTAVRGTTRSLVAAALGRTMVGKSNEVHDCFFLVWWQVCPFCINRGRYAVLG